MTAIGMLLGWTGLPRIIQEAIFAALLAGGVVLGYGLWHHKVLVQGIHAQQQADARASAKVVAQARAQTIAAQSAANAAEEAYRAEITRIHADARPLGPVRLCIDTYRGGGRMPETASAQPGNANSSTATAGVSQVHGGNSGLRARGGPDISQLLSAFASRSDQLSAELREFQSRQVHP